MQYNEKLSNEKLGAFQQVSSGYDIGNLSTQNKSFIKSKTKNPLSFKIKDIETVGNSSEILKVLFSNGLVARIIKFTDKENRASSSFDIVDELKKEILVNTDKSFTGGTGIAESLFKINFISQWEVPIFTKLCRGFILGDPESIKKLMFDYNLKITEDTEWKIKEIIGVSK
jgi:hypothetical protein